MSRLTPSDMKRAQVALIERLQDSGVLVDEDFQVGGLFAPPRGEQLFGAMRTAISNHAVHADKISEAPDDYVLHNTLKRTGRPLELATMKSMIDYSVQHALARDTQQQQEASDKWTDMAKIRTIIEQMR